MVDELGKDVVGSGSGLF